MGVHASFNYCVRDRETGEIAAEGSARECAERLGVIPDTIRKWGRAITAINGRLREWGWKFP